MMAGPDIEPRVVGWCKTSPCLEDLLGLPRRAGGAPSEVSPGSASVFQQASVNDPLTAGEVLIGSHRVLIKRPINVRELRAGR
jgi:hypothetical protein